MGMRLLWLALLVSVTGIYSQGARGEIPEHLVTELPGQPIVNFSQYAGYINLNEPTGKAIFYWFVEADHPHAASLPVTFWFNGGPGCSSVGDGFLSELGPFRVSSTGNLTFNKHTWNKERSITIRNLPSAANVIFVESPVAVGYSYSNTTSDYAAFGDAQTAGDTYTFLVNWYKSYPEYRKNDMYITGESYGGHYVPTLVQQVVHNNAKPGAYYLNLKGFAVGNAWTDAYYDNKGSVEYFLSHSLISNETYTTLIESCDFGHEFPIGSPNANGFCINATNTLYNVDLSGLDVYNIYGLSCNLPYSNSSRSFMKGKVPFFPASAAIDPCLDYVTPYLNTAAVKAALHASPNIEWAECSTVVFNKYNITDVLTSMIPVYRELLQTGLRIWVYSGDFDGRVPTTGTREWINQLGLTIKKPWYPWVHTGSKESKTGGGQVAGYTQVYESNFTFATVRAAGHLVPADQPERALALFRGFLSGDPLQAFVFPSSPSS